MKKLKEVFGYNVDFQAWIDSLDPEPKSMKELWDRCITGEQLLLLLWQAGVELEVVSPAIERIVKRAICRWNGITSRVHQASSSLEAMSQEENISFIEKFEQILVDGSLGDSLINLSNDCKDFAEGDLKYYFTVIPASVMSFHYGDLFWEDGHQVQFQEELQQASDIRELLLWESVEPYLNRLLA